MAQILITGATGNVGRAVLDNLGEVPGMRIWKASHKLPLRNDERYFDFDNLPESTESLKGIDALFLLRPPQLSDTEKYFAPLIQACQQQGLKHIVFLSVQGVEQHAIIPHAKIEKMIEASGIAYTFMRPSYFMQNLTTTLQDDIRHRGLISLPSGRAKFLWVDVNDIGKAIAVVLRNPDRHRHKKYAITGTELLNFKTVAQLLSQVLGKPIRFESPNVIRFFLQKRRQGMPASFILVILLIHVMPRFEKEPPISNDFTQLTGQQPNTLENFLQANQSLLQ